MEHGGGNSGTSDKMEQYKNQVIYLLAFLFVVSFILYALLLQHCRLNNCLKSWTRDPHRKWVLSPILTFFSKSNAVSTVSLLSFRLNFFSPSYLIENGICYLTLTEKSYPKRLAFLFLEEISHDFETELRAEHGDE